MNTKAFSISLGLSPLTWQARDPAGHVFFFSKGQVAPECLKTRQAHPQNPPNPSTPLPPPPRKQNQTTHPKKTQLPSPPPSPKKKKQNQEAPALPPKRKTKNKNNEETAALLPKGPGPLPEAFGPPGRCPQGAAGGRGLFVSRGAQEKGAVTLNPKP